MAKRLKTCRMCGRGMPKDCTKCQYCNTETLGVVMRKRLFDFSMVSLVLFGSWFIAHKAIEIKEYMENPPIHQFDLNYDVEKFADFKNIDDFGQNNWLYKFSGDATKGVQGVAAQTISTNVAKLKMPYGSSKMEITLVKNKKDEVEVLLQVIGQFECTTAKADCHLVARFDNQKAERFNFKIAPNGRDDLIYLVEKEKFVERMKASKQLALSVNIYNNGFVKYYFNVKNLIFTFNATR